MYKVTALCVSLLLLFNVALSQSEKETVDQAQKRLLASPTAKLWEKVGFEPKDGFAISVPALRSKVDCGIGEYTDLIPLFPWCQKIGLKVIQLLPIFESDHSPYTLISSCALNPLYLGLRSLPEFNTDAALVKLADRLAESNQDQRIDLTGIAQKKLQILSIYYEKFKQKIEDFPGFKAFQSENREWLDDYALYKAIAETYLPNLSWREWDEKDKNLQQNRKQLYEKHRKRMDFYICLQYLCYIQMAQVKAEAAAHSISLVGDIPFGVGMDSADTYAYPSLFMSHLTVGAAPDAFSAQGQNWGLPAYNWPAIAANDYRWWQRRVEIMNRFFDYYRLDHCLGFYHMWVIPEGVNASDGHFSPPYEKEAVKQGEEILKSLIRVSKALPIAEIYTKSGSAIDDSVKALGIPKIVITTLAREDNFFQPYEYPFATLLTLSIHDLPIFANLWRKDPEFAKTFSSTKKIRALADAPNEYIYLALQDIHQSSCFLRINPLQEYLWMIPELSHSTPEEERINIPGTSSPWNWGFRHVPTVEELVSNNELQILIFNLLNGKPYTSLRTSAPRK